MGLFHFLISADAATSLEQTPHQPENKAVSVASFLGALKLQKATLRFVISVRMEHLGSHWKDFRKILYLRIFRKICRFDKNVTSRPMFIYDSLFVFHSPVAGFSLIRVFYEGWNFNSGNYLFTADTK